MKNKKPGCGNSPAFGFLRRSFWRIGALACDGFGDRAGGLGQSAAGEVAGFVGEFLSACGVVDLRGSLAEFFDFAFTFFAMKFGPVDADVAFQFRVAGRRNLIDEVEAGVGVVCGVERGAPEACFVHAGMAGAGGVFGSAADVGLQVGIVGVFVAFVVESAEFQTGAG